MSAVHARRGWQRDGAWLAGLAVLGLAACGGGHGSSFTPAGPMLDPIGDQEIEPTRSLVLRLTASNPDDARLIYSSSALPPNAALVASTGLFVFTPAASQAGANFTVTFTVSEGAHEDSESVLIRVTSTVPPANDGPTLAPIGDHEVRVGETLAVQQHAIDPDGDAITFSVHPQLPANASYDSHTGLFTFTPSAAQVGDYPLSFIADDGYSVDYETVHVAVRAQTSGTPSVTNAPPGTPTPTSTPACQVTIPTGCTALAPSAPSASPSSSATPAPPPNLVVDNQCYTVGSGSYTYTYVNVVHGGQLIFVDDGGTIDFRVSSLLVEQGGAVQAGSLECPFGSANGKLEIGLWGTDPTDQGTNRNPATPGITCGGQSGTCYDAGLTATHHYCVQPTPPATPTGTWSPSDPCDVTVPSGDENLYGNALFEGYEALNFDYGKSYFGYKVFAVSYGGSLQLFGRKGVADADLSPEPQTSCDTPDDQYDLDKWAQLSGSSWGRLDRSVSAGQTTITLDRAVDWSSGDRLVIGTTDWYPSHSEEVLVQSASTAAGKTTLTLDAPLDYAHNGEKYPVPPTPRATAGNLNTELELRAPVGLLSRSIKIYSLGETADEPFPNPESDDWNKCGYANNSDVPPAHPECYFGGQVMVRQGFDTFQLQGVEMRQLGQGGRQGHYPMHWHMVKSTDYTDAYVKDCSIWDSMDRFVVLHATHGVTVSRNVGYMSIGHGFYLEDGSEIDNLLCQNLAVSVRGSFEEFFENQPSTSPSYRYVPPILDGAEQEVEQGFVFGGDTLLPVAFWTMNTWNELVGNAAAGVYGFGSCYWFLGSGVSGPSQELTWTHSSDTPADYAGFNVAGSQQAPVKRFRTNSCSSSTYGLQTTLEVQPTGNTAAQTGYTPATNPYILCEDCRQTCERYGPTSPQCTGCEPGRCRADQYDRPMAEGNFLPVKYGSNPSCASGLPEESLFSTNPDYCVTTLIDRFTTSFNHPGADFGAVWLRPQWFVFMNSAITDQLGGGLGFITGGSWTQTPPGYFSITKNSVFVGSTQVDNPDAAAVGPNLCPSPTPASTCAENCDAAGGAMCVLPAEGIALFTGGFNSKRMISIYDGPFYADGSVFTDTEPFVCDTTGPAPFSDPNSCQIYSSSTEPQHPLTTSNGTPTPSGTPAPTGSPQMQVVNAAVGWKQPNGFYYPPAFAFRKTGFDAGTFRHNVIDQYATYLQGSLVSPTGQPEAFAPLGQTYAGITPIDFSTILNDMDGTLTGWQPEGGTRTSSVSQNAFFNAPSQDAECKSFGVQTSPYEFVSSVIAPLGGTTPSLYVDSGVWGIANTPAVPIYRQLVLPDDQCVGDQSVCCASPYTDCTQGSVGCTRGSFMLGGQGGQAPYLTSNNGVYYIDTNQQEDNPSCFQQSVFEPGFTGGKSYVLYNLFANENTNITYQLYVGDDFNNCAGGQWVLVQPHVYNQNGNNTVVTPITDNAVVAALDAGITVNKGVLQVIFDHSAIKDAYRFASKPDYDVCLPRDICQIDTTTSNSCTIQAQASFLDGNATDYTDYQSDVTSICTYWATATAGRTSLPNTPGDDADDPLFADCPAGGCLGYAFTLPSSFAAKPYKDVGAPLTGCFDESWNVAMDRLDADCPNPATPNPTAFCPAGNTPTPIPNMPCATFTATGGTPTSTATHTGPTPTPTGTASPLPTAPGGTATATAPLPTQTPTPVPGTATSTPTAAAATPTSTPAATPSGPLVWIANPTMMTATPLAQLTGIATSGATYLQGQLQIHDDDKRFCTSAGTTPQVQVEVSSTDLLTVGLYAGTSTASVDVAALPAAPPGTYAVIIQTFPACDGSKPPIQLTMPSAIVYQ